MSYLEQVRADPDHNRYVLMRQQALNAAAVYAGSAVLDRDLFGPIARYNADSPTEPDGSMTPIKDVVSAFAGGLYSLAYGPTAAKQHFSRLTTVARAVSQWNTALNQTHNTLASPARFRRLFFEGGLWHVFIDRYTTPEDGTRSRLQEASDRGDFSALHKDRDISSIVRGVYPFFRRIPPAEPPSHSGSHFDATWFANTILHVGETEMQLEDEASKKALLADSLPELRRLTVLEMEGVNLAAGFLGDTRWSRYHRKYIKADRRRRHVGLDMDTILERVEDELPEAANRNHRGCPVLYLTTPFTTADLTTPFKGGEVPIFRVMDETLIRIYSDTGALSIPALRMGLPRKTDRID